MEEARERVEVAREVGAEGMWVEFAREVEGRWVEEARERLKVVGDREKISPRELLGGVGSWGVTSIKDGYYVAPCQQV